ncbi:MAG: polysaccharide biosynthesis/export family protein [Candidatus Competibacter sp.]|nr:polysaccharide biosynthesis/export family protein [Candidatus Contendobacter sp.]MDS4041999.1 polysaccharide biosynthesis/export family protein [Candidatus Competibacter sp.]
MCVALPAALFGIVSCAGTNQPTTDAGTTAVPAIARVPSADPSGSPAVPAVAGATVAKAALPSSGNAPGGLKEYQIGPQDLLKVEVFGVPDLNRSVRVNSNGQISLPLLGLVQAGGMTAEKLAADIAARLAKDYLQNPQVTIFIEEFTSQRVTVVGAVKNPGVYPLKGRTTLLQVVAAAGDPTTVAKQGSVRVLRNESDGSRKLLEYDLEAIRDGNLPDPEVLGEDVVQVETSAVKATAKQVMEFVMPFWIFAP